MKKTRTFILLGLLGLIMVGCAKEQKTFNRFMLNDPMFTSDGEKVYLDYNVSGSRLLYEDGDYLRINGEQFTVEKVGSNWYASGTEITADKFYVAYASDNKIEAGSAGPEYWFDFRTNYGSSRCMVLAGASDSNVLTLTPACAVIRFYSGGASYDWVRIGFEASKVPSRGKVSATTGRISGPCTYLAGVTSGGAGQFLEMQESPTSDYYYVAVPIEGSSISTYIYFDWQQSGQSQTKYRTSGQVTLQPGKVYSVGSTRVAPFDENGKSRSFFQVDDEGTTVFFSAGNLQYNAALTTWRFAETQYQSIGVQNTNISAVYGGYIDLFGFGTTGYQYGYDEDLEKPLKYSPFLTSLDPAKYPAATLNANTDWGRYLRGNIKYGNNFSSSTVEWRSLTQENWSYLLSRVGKWGLATIDDMYQGLVLLPDGVIIDGTPYTWAQVVPYSGCFTAGYGSGYGTNSYTLEQWAQMENAGAIFFPACGKRQGTGVIDAGTDGYYWTKTYDGGANIARFGYDEDWEEWYAEIGTSATPIGNAVRLVVNR